MPPTRWCHGGDVIEAIYQSARNGAGRFPWWDLGPWVGSGDEQSSQKEPVDGSKSRAQR
jgi:hypothetical protein